MMIQLPPFIYQRLSRPIERLFPIVAMIIKLFQKPKVYLSIYNTNGNYYSLDLPKNFIIPACCGAAGGFRANQAAKQDIKAIALPILCLEAEAIITRLF